VALIRDIAENPSLPLNAKLRQVLTTIGKTYNRLLHASANEFKHTRHDYDELVRRIETMFRTIGPFIERDCSVTRFVSVEDGPAEAIAAIRELKDRFLLQQGELAKLQDILKDMARLLHAQDIHETRDELEKLLQFMLELRQQVRTGRDQLKQQKVKARQAAEALQEQEQAANESITLLNEKVRFLERERKQLLKQTDADQKEITKLQIAVDKANRDGANQVHETENKYHEIQEQIKAEYSQERRRLMEELDSKSARIEESSDLCQKLEIDIAEAKRSIKLFSEDNNTKEEEIQRLRTKLNEINSEWNTRIEKEKESIRLQTEELLKTVKKKNQELRALCAKTNESMSNTEQHNRVLIQRVNSLERELEQITQQSTVAKEELARERQLIETKSRAAGVRLELKYQSEVEELKTAWEDEKRRIGACLAVHFESFVDMRQSLDSRMFKDIIERARVEMAKLRDADAALRRLLCLSADDSLEDAVGKLLLSLYRQ
jgi:DNA repair exonuclease SbcCD ATPase subunit